MDRALNKKEFAARIGVSVRTLERMVARREVGYTRIRGRVRFTEKHFQELMEAGERPAKVKRFASVNSKAA